MGNYIIKQAADVRTISTLSGDFALKWDDQTPMSMNAHAVIAANLWSIFTRLGEDGAHREAATSRPLLQSCIARLSRHAGSGIVTINTSPCEKAAPIYRAIVSVLSRTASASLGPLRPLRGSLRSGYLIASRQANVERRTA